MRRALALPGSEKAYSSIPPTTTTSRATTVAPIATTHDPRSASLAPTSNRPNPPSWTNDEDDLDFRVPEGPDDLGIDPDINRGELPELPDNSDYGPDKERDVENSINGGEENEEEVDDEDTSWDNGEPLTAEERIEIMRLDVFSRAEEMKRRRRKRIDAEDMSWDNGEPLTPEERIEVMKLDKRARANEMQRRKRKRLDQEDASWDNGEPLTTEERAEMMCLPVYERTRAMNIRRNKRMEQELRDGYASFFKDIGGQRREKAPPKPRPRTAATSQDEIERRRSTRNKR